MDNNMDNNSPDSTWKTVLSPPPPPPPLPNANIPLKLKKYNPEYTDNELQLIYHE